MKVWATAYLLAGFGLTFSCATPLAMAEDAPSAYGKFSASGDAVIIPARSWDLSAVASNQIHKIYFIEGQFVKKGDLLVEFDTEFKKYDARLGELEVIRAKAALEEAREELARKKKLSSLAVSEVELRETEIEVEVAEANVESAELLAAKAKAISDLQKIYAPFDGQLSAPLFRDNANVNVAEDTEIATIFQLDPVHVRVEGNYERLQTRVSAGQTEDEVLDSLTLVLELPDGSKYPHQGKLLTTPYKYDSETGVGHSIAEFPNPDRVLRPGLQVKVTSYEKQE